MNPEIDDGGPAFPAGPFGDTMHGEDGRVRHQHDRLPGMSLRDYFAGEALKYTAKYCLTYSIAANDAYKYADAMIFARTAHLKGNN